MKRVISSTVEEIINIDNTENGQLFGILDTENYNNKYMFLHDGDTQSYTLYDSDGEKVGGRFVNVKRMDLTTTTEKHEELYVFENVKELLRWMLKTGK